MMSQCRRRGQAAQPGREAVLIDKTESASGFLSWTASSCIGTTRAISAHRQRTLCQTKNLHPVAIDTAGTGLWVDRAAAVLPAERNDTHVAVPNRSLPALKAASVETMQILGSE
jgi:hypothetical protein